MISPIILYNVYFILSFKVKVDEKKNCYTWVLPEKKEEDKWNKFWPQQ